MVEEGLLERIKDLEQFGERFDELADGVERNFKVLYRIIEGVQLPNLGFEKEGLIIKVGKNKENYLWVEGLEKEAGMEPEQAAVLLPDEKEPGLIPPGLQPGPEESNQASPKEDDGSDEEPEALDEDEDVDE